MKQVILVAIFSSLASLIEVSCTNETQVNLMDKIIPASIGINYGQGPVYGPPGYGTQQNQYANRQGCLPTGECVKTATTCR